MVKDANLKMYHVMSVKQSLREDLAEHSYQFSCRAADWSRLSFSHVPMQFEPPELHIVDATAFLYARLFEDRDTDLGGNEIFMRSPKILIDNEVVAEGVV